MAAVETRQRSDGTVYRRRRCPSCGHRAKTVEAFQEVPYPTQRRKRKPGPRKGRKQPGVNRATGESNGASVLTAKDVRRLRQLAARGMLQKDIAVKFGIATATVSRIVTRKLWAHLP